MTIGKRLGMGFGVVLALVLILAAPEESLAKGLSYEGSTTIGENIMPEAVKAFETKTRIKFDKIGGLGSGKGFKQVMTGGVDIAGMSRALTYEEKQEKPYYQVIGYDAIAVFVNEKNPVKDLSKKQLKDIFTGKLTNWKDVGGNEVPIVVVTEIKTGERATIAEFKEMALDGLEFGSTKEIDKPVDCVHYVAMSENAITHASIAFRESGAKIISLNKIELSTENMRSGLYLLTRPLLLVTKEAPRGEAKKFFDFILSQEGQEIVGGKFIPIR